MKYKLLLALSSCSRLESFLLKNLIFLGIVSPDEPEATHVTCAAENSIAEMFSGNGSTILTLSAAKEKEKEKIRRCQDI